MKLENRQTLLAILAGAAVALFAADKLVLTPLANGWSARSKSIAELSAKVRDARGLVDRGPSLRSHWDQMRANALTNDASQAEQQLLNAIYRWSQDSRVTLVSVSPQSKHDADDYSTVECRVEAAGTINAVTSFLYDLEKDPMAVKLQMVEVTARDNDGQQFALGLQVSGLLLTTADTRTGGAVRR